LSARSYRSRRWEAATASVSDAAASSNHGTKPSVAAEDLST
jgi:hypothetical protein